MYLSFNLKIDKSAIIYHNTEKYMWYYGNDESIKKNSITATDYFMLIKTTDYNDFLVGYLTKSINLIIALAFTNLSWYYYFDKLRVINNY